MSEATLTPQQAQALQEQKRRERDARVPESASSGKNELPKADPADLATALGTPKLLQFEERVKYQVEDQIAEVQIRQRTIEIHPFPLTNSQVGKWQSLVPLGIWCYALSRDKEEDDYNLEKTTELLNKVTGREATNPENPPYTPDNVRYVFATLFTQIYEEPLELLDPEDVEPPFGKEGDEGYEDELASYQRQLANVERQNRQLEKANRRSQENNPVTAMVNLVLASANVFEEQVSEAEVRQILTLPFFIDWAWKMFQVNQRQKARF